MSTCYNLGEAKTPWSWGRMHNILSEGRKIESRRQLQLAIALRSKTQSEKLETKQAHAREQPHRHAGGRSKWTRSEARKARKEKKERETER